MALFKPDRRLLNVNFQGYKLAEDSLDLVRVELPSLVRVAELKDDDFSYQHIRAYSLHNHLHFDPSDPSSVYWCAEDGSIVKATLLDDSVSLQSVFSFSTAKLSEFANASILFFNRSMGVVCAGGSEIVLFARSNSILDSTPEKWSILKSLEISDNKPVMVTTVAMAATGMHVDMLCVELGKPLPNSAGIVYMWIRINFKVNLALRQGTPGDIGDVCVLNKFESKSLCLYATFQHQPSKRNVQLLFLNETTPLTEQDEPIDEAGKNAKILEESLLEEPNRHYGIGYEKNSYEWNQTEEEVVITFKLPPDVNKKDIFCEFESNEVVVGLSDGTSLMRGELTHSIDQEASTWTIQDNILEVTLEKQVEGVDWKYLLKDSSRSEGADTHYPLNQGLGDELSSEKLEEMLSGNAETMGSSPSKKHCPVIQNVLEECDHSDKDSIMFIISEHGELKQKVDLGGCQLVFTAPCPGNHSHYFSLRHDVDAIVWLPHVSLTSSHSRWAHVSTFNALGYVQASKRERKFSTASPNLRYAVISDCTGHVFVYLQPVEREGNSAQEYVYSFPKQTNILGVIASDPGDVFVLTNNELNILRIPIYKKYIMS